jgi:NADH dehydrogenase
MAAHLATVFGGSGFIGRHVVQRLATQGWRVRVAVRNPTRAEFLKPLGDVGQVVPVFADITKEASVQAAVMGAKLVVNAVGILVERGRSSFQAIHVDGAARIAAAARQAGAAVLVHVSAIAANDDSPSAYARSKAAGEAAVLASFPTATVLRPSVVFGPEDAFFNLFADMAAFTPVLPVFVTDGFRLTRPAEGGCRLFGSGGTKLQPVYVGDVADAVVAATASTTAGGKIFELGGPRIFSLKEIMELVMSASGRRRLLLPLPLAVARLQAFFLQFLPNPPLTPDQVKLLAADSVVAPGSLGLADLGIAPTAAEVIVPTYLARFRNPYDTAARR